MTLIKPTVITVLLLLKTVSFPIHLSAGITKQIAIKRETIHWEKATQKSTLLELCWEAVMSKFIIEVTFSQTKSSEDTCECFALGSILEYTVVFFKAEGQIEEGRVTIYIPKT